MSIDRGTAENFVEDYIRVWEAWDAPGFADLFSEDAVYYEHPIDEALVSREPFERYIHKEQAEGGKVSVRMGRPMVDGNQLFAEFWTLMDAGGDRTLSGCFVAELDPGSGNRRKWGIHLTGVESADR